MVPLQEVFRAAFDLGLYERRLPYPEPLSPPLSAEEAVWAQERVREAGRL